MKTRELIALLQAADPTGEVECVVGSDDVYFVSKAPMYYDGRPWLLVHGWALLVHMHPNLRGGAQSEHEKRA